MATMPVEGVNYKVSKWGIYKNYECMKCQYSSLWYDKIVKHHLEARKHKHKWRYPQPKDPNKPVVDNGEPTY